MTQEDIIWLCLCGAFLLAGAGVHWAYMQVCAWRAEKQGRANGRD